MKKAVRNYLLLASCIYLIAGIAAINMVSGWITEHYFETMGENTLNLASVAANAISVSDEQLKELERIPFSELLQNENNKEFSSIFQRTELSGKVKYAYVVRKLENTDVKYSVSSSDAAFYEMTVGTPLNWVWLMDVLVSEDSRAEPEKDREYYTDKNRYTHVRGETKELYESRKKGYFFNHDEWGSQISGVVPIYTTEGQYIGLLGVDVYSTDFYAYRNKVLSVISLLLLIPTGILTSVYVSFHLRYRKEMKSIVFQDKMTGLYTRAYYEDYARQQLKQLRRVDDSITVIMLDIDEFKAFNDFYGHTRGDECIKRIAEVIRLESEIAGGCAGRYGGEEFISIIPRLSIEGGELLCERIRNGIEDLNIPHESRKDLPIITISLGVYTGFKTDSPLELKKLVEKADQALYAAKRSGKNCFRREQ